MAALSSSQPRQVFINYSDEKNVQLQGFVDDLVETLKSNKINVCTNKDEDRSHKVHLKSRFEPKIALVIFSGKYTESTSRLSELAKIHECVEKGKVVAIPIFFKLDASTVKDLRGQFGDTLKHLRESKEKKIMYIEALKSISKSSSHKVEKKSPKPGPKSEIFNNIVEDVQEKMKEVRLMESQKAPKPESVLGDSYIRKDKSYGIKQSLKLCSLMIFLFILQQVVFMRTPFDTVKVKEMETTLPMPNFPPAHPPPPPLMSLSNGIYGRQVKVKERVPMSFISPFKIFPIIGKKKPPNIQVFINFRGAQLRQSFISYLVDALRRSEINVFIDILEERGEDINNLFKRIEGSGIAIVVFSSMYTESHWCLDELVKIKERAHQGLLKVLPIYYKVTISNVKRLKGEFGDHFRDKEYMYQSDETKIKQWKEAIAFISKKFALSFDERSTIVEADFVRTVVEEVLRMLRDI